jgi:hypothetical protein
MSGVVILDATCVKYLEDPAERLLITGSLRAAGMTIFPTAVNLVEVSKTANARVAARAYETLAALAARVGVLPIPQEILAATGRALLDGRGRYHPTPISCDVALDAEGAIAADFRDAALQYTAPFEESRVAHFAKWRPTIQRQLKEKGIVVTDADDFLRRQWDGTEAQDTYARILWGELGLESYPGLPRLLAVGAWRVFLGAEGYALFERLALKTQLPRAAGFVDLSQLVYATAGDRAIFVTDDQGLRRAARAVFKRYLVNAWVEDWRAFRTHHPDPVA